MRLFWGMFLIALLIRTLSRDGHHEILKMRSESLYLLFSLYSSSPVVKLHFVQSFFQSSQISKSVLKVSNQ